MQPFTLDLYTGSRQGPDDTTALTLDLEANVPITADQLSVLVSIRLQQSHRRGYELEAKFIHPALWDPGAQRWHLLPREDDVQIPPTTHSLTAVVLADVSYRAVGMNENRSVTLKEVVRSPMLWYAVHSNSSTSYTRQYPSFSSKDWDDLSGVLPFLDGHLGDKTTYRDPRERGKLTTYTGSEAQANDMYVEVACDVVSSVVNELHLPGIDKIAFRTFQPSQQFKGFPDFACVPRNKVYMADPTDHLLTGEGKVVEVFDNETSITGAVVPCARQAADYIEKRYHTYGWLTNQHGSLFFCRKGDDEYAVTELIPWYQSGCGVIAMLTYITIQQLLAQPWQRCSSNTSPTAQLGVLTRAQQKALAASSSSAGVVTRSAADRMTSGGAIAGSSSKNASSRFMKNRMHPNEALQLFDRVLGHGIVGQVTAGSYYGRDCAAKIIDAGKQRRLLPMMEHEIAIYDRLKHLQGFGIPILFGCGFIDHGNSFFFAMSEIKHTHHPGSDLPRSAQDAAKQVLGRVHEAGLLHGDIRRENVLLCEEDGSWQAWLIDFGMARDVTTQEECSQEDAALLALFRQSLSSEGSGNP